MRPEQVREIVREEIEKRLQKDPIPGPSFEGGAGGKWEPKKGEQVHYQFQAGLIFPDTPAGKLGAELRAKQGIVPYPEKSDPAKIETLISEIERMIFEVQTETEFRSEFDFMNEKLEEIRNEVAAMFQEPTPK